MADNRCADSIACDVDGGTQHIENTVDTHDKSDTLRWQSDGIQYHSQGNKSDAWDTGGTDGSQCCGNNNRCEVCRGQMNTVRLCDEDDSDTLHNGGTIHVDGCAERNGERRDLFRDTHFFVQCINRHRDCCVGGCGGKCKSHNRKEFLHEFNRIQPCEYEQKNLINDEALQCQRQCYISHVFQHRCERRKADRCKGTCNQTENADRGHLHDRHGHFHHDIVKLADKVGNDRSAVSELCQHYADKQGEYDDGKHIAVCHGTNRVLRDDVEQCIHQADAGICCCRGQVGFLNRTHVKSEPRVNEQGGSKCDADGKCCGNKVKADRFYADLSEGFAVSDGHTSADEGAEDKRYDKHLHQADKALSDDIQHTFYDDGVLDIAGRDPIVNHHAEQRTGQQGNKNLGGKSGLLF